jgi:UTP--glucose-1-phosphate uridylyltransferase
LNYFKKNSELEKTLIKRKKENALRDLKEFEETFKGIDFSFVVQKDPLGDGHAISQASKLIKNEAVVNSFGDDIVDCDEPAMLQLINIFKTCNAPVVALKKLPQDKIPAYGSVAVEKIANRLYKIKKIIEKPAPSEIQSDLVVVGKHVLTPEVFQYLKKAKPTKKGEIILAEVLGKMLDEGKIIYGYELRGEWLECGDKAKWLKSFLYFALRDPRFKDELKQYIKTIK